MVYAAEKKIAIESVLPNYHLISTSLNYTDYKAQILEAA